MNDTNSSRSFSLATLLLLMTTLVCATGWIAARLRLQRTEARALSLARVVEKFQANSAQLDVVDRTKVHAVGLPKSGWLMYFPKGKYLFHCYVGPYDGNDLQGPFERAPMFAALELDGETFVDATLVCNADDASWHLKFSLPGQTSRKKVPWKLDSKSASFERFTISTRQRAVWEPGESFVLMSRQPVDLETGARGEVVAVWVEPLSRMADADDEPAESIETIEIGAS